MLTGVCSVVMEVNFFFAEVLFPKKLGHDVILSGGKAAVRDRT
jgi:hypothetical protein